MTQVLNRALPFLLAFVLGIACTAIIRGFWPTHRRAFSDNGRPRCKEKARKNFSSGSFVSVQKDATTFEITQIQGSGWTGHSTVTLPNRGLLDENGLTLKEQALLIANGRAGLGSSTNFVVSYASPDAVDGQPVTSDAVLSNVPRPRVWHAEQDSWKALDCNAILRVELDSSGRVTRVEKVPAYADGCSNLRDIVDAASEITFQPALREGVPVSQRISIMYTLH